MKNIGIILSGGTGTRMGLDVPKQYLKVNDRYVFEYSLCRFLAHADIDCVVMCVAQEWRGVVEEVVASLQSPKPVFYSLPGETRQMTIFNAITKIGQMEGVPDDAVVVIHDAARPLVSEELISSCIAENRKCDGVLPVIPVKDTIYKSIDGHKVAGLLDRNQLFADQAPESFRLDKYLSAHHRLTLEQVAAIKGSTEIAFKAGMDIHMIEGDEMNFKITTMKDLQDLKKVIGDVG